MRGKNQKIGKNKNFRQSLNYALEGLVLAAKTEKNIRIDIYVTVLIIILALMYGVTRSQLKDLVSVITLVFFAELINTAIEAAIDISTTKYHPLAKKAKDISAGAVLIVTVNAAVVGYLIFSKKIKEDTGDFFRILTVSYSDTFLFILTLVVLGVFVGKVYYKKGTLLKGGMPSGHSAIAFSLWVGMSFASKNIVVTIMGFCIALLVAQSRIEGKIHSPKEVLAGSILGTFTTYFLLKIIF